MPWPKEEPTGPNPPEGAMINYYLKSASSGPVTLEIRQQDGRLVRRYSSSDPVADIPDPDSFLNPLCHSAGGANFACYNNRDVDALLLTGRNTRSATARVDVYRDAERRVLQDAALVPLFHPLSAVAIQENVRGLHITAMGFGNMALESVWLADGPPPPQVANAANTGPSDDGRPSAARRPLEGRVP
jgi:ABC-type transport system substrate-binding protein